MTATKAEWFTGPEKLLIEVSLDGEWLETADRAEIEAAIEIQLDDLIEEYGELRNGYCYRSKLADSGKGCLSVNTKVPSHVFNDDGGRVVADIFLEFAITAVNKKFGRRLAV